MSRKKQKKAREVKAGIRRQIARHVSAAFPGCVAEFVGHQGGLAPIVRTLGFQVRDARGRLRSNIIWLDPEYDGEINEAWVKWAVRDSNG